MYNVKLFHVPSGSQLHPVSTATRIITNLLDGMLVHCRGLSLKVGQGRGDGDARTRIWEAELGDARPGTWGRVYGGTRGREDAGR